MFSRSTPYVIKERLVSMLRWLALLALTVSLGLYSGISSAILIFVLAAAIWNIFLTGFLVSDRFLRIHRILSVVGDLVVAHTLFYLSGGIFGGIAWVGLLPLISSALLMGYQWALVIAGVNLLSQGLLSIAFSEVWISLLFTGLLAPLYLGFGLVFGLIAQRFSTLLDRRQRMVQKSRREAERERKQRRSAFYQMIAALSATLNYQKVLESALDLSADAVSDTDEADDRMVSCVLLYTNDQPGRTLLRVGSARKFTPSDINVSIPGTAGLIGRAIDEGLPCLLLNLEEDPELVRFVALQACQAAYCVPLRTGLETYGVLLFAHPQADFFNAERREILTVVGNQAKAAIQNARLYRDLKLEKERMMEIQEEARKKLARDLHDGPTQVISAIAMRVNIARRLLARDLEQAAKELYKIEDQARQTVKEIRHMLFTLRPLVLESEGLIAALEAMAEKMRENYHQNVLVSADPAIVERLEISKQSVIFYIVEEAVNNARKHARARHIWVRLKSAEKDVVLLEIEDDGIGFDASAVEAQYERRSSLGLVNMRERAELVGGYFQIDTQAGRGTLITLLVPLTEDAAARIQYGN